MKQIIKMALKKTGITQKELAEKLFVTPQAVSKWVRGESEPTHDKVVAMSKIFGFEKKSGKARKILFNFVGFFRNFAGFLSRT